MSDAESKKGAARRWLTRLVGLLIIVALTPVAAVARGVEAVLWCGHGLYLLSRSVRIFVETWEWFHPSEAEGISVWPTLWTYWRSWLRRPNCNEDQG